jgi:hypothetical protein
VSPIYWCKQIKTKKRSLAQQGWGFYAWIEPKIGKTRQRNPFVILSLKGEMKN